MIEKQNITQHNTTKKANCLPLVQKGKTPGEALHFGLDSIQQVAPLEGIAP